MALRKLLLFSSTWETEALYLKDNISVSNFNLKRRTAKGAITTEGYYNELELNFELIDDYTLAYIVNS
jgi:hypothetical protein